MAQITANTLMISIQCLNRHNNNLVQEINKRTDDELEKSVLNPEYCDPELKGLQYELLDFLNAEGELQNIYIKRQQESDNLRPYEELLGEQFSLK